MSNQPLISICIPAYKRIDYIRRLLDSIDRQSFRHFEVIITDDSPDNSLQTLCETHNTNYHLTYCRNKYPLGTPQNWNEAIRRSSGQWIKLMHDDDWFSDENSLEYFARAIADNPGAGFIFSAYRNIQLEGGDAEDVFVRPARYRSLLRKRVILFSGNIIGPPSVVLHRGSPLLYDNKIKWLVDVDFYIRFLKTNRPVYINRILINVGMGDQQVTHESFRRRTIEIPENFYLLNKLGPGILKNPRIFDAWWRLIRNLEIRQESAISEAGYDGDIPEVVLSMLRWQGKVPRSLLKNGFFSKPFMLLCYIFNFNKIGK
jgi:glycosyltransferase involved in cell wall biosynthesis